MEVATRRVMAKSVEATNREDRLSSSVCREKWNGSLATNGNGSIPTRIREARLSCYSCTPSKCTSRATTASLYKRHDLGRFPQTSPRSYGSVNLGHYW